MYTQQKNYRAFFVRNKMTHQTWNNGTVNIFLYDGGSPDAPACGCSHLSTGNDISFRM